MNERKNSVGFLQYVHVRNTRKSCGKSGKLRKPKDAPTRPQSQPFSFVHERTGLRRCAAEALGKTPHRPSVCALRSTPCPLPAVPSCPGPANFLSGRTVSHVGRPRRLMGGRPRHPRPAAAAGSLSQHYSAGVRRRCISGARRRRGRCARAASNLLSIARPCPPSLPP